MSKTSLAFAPPKPRFVVVGIMVMAIASWYAVNLPQPQPLNETIKIDNIQAKAIETIATRVAVPEGWKTENPTEGVTAYTLSIEEKTDLEYDAVNSLETQSSELDGTRHPYVSNISEADLIRDTQNPNRYFWKGVWQGEGYNRVVDQDHQLVAERKKSVDIYLSISLDTSITDATKPNLTITLKSDQDETAQLTNISAFQIDPKTGKTLDRQDFPQLPPVYEVTASRNGGYAGTEIKELEPLGTVTFAYHVSAEQVKQNLPLRLSAVNRLFTERQQEIYDLQAKGWIVKEVPAPSY